MRGKGKSAFFVLRQQTATAQACLFSDDNSTVTKQMVKYATMIPKESIVDVGGLLVESNGRVVQPVGRGNPGPGDPLYQPLGSELPFDLADAARSEREIEDALARGEKTGQGRTGHEAGQPRDRPEDPGQQRHLQDSVCSVPAVQGGPALQRLCGDPHAQSSCPGHPREARRCSTSTTWVGPACLAQSPQFYKQMAICGDMARVFEIGSVFRAEDSNTHRHLTEFIGLDMEMAIYESYEEVLDVLDHLFVYMFQGLQGRFAKELAVISQQYPVEPLKYLPKTLRITFAEGIRLLHDAGHDVPPLDDLSTEMERTLGNLVKDKYGTDFYILHKFPLGVRPFYTMPDPEDENYSASFDIFIRGEEIISGAQRVHDPKFCSRPGRSSTASPPIRSRATWTPSNAVAIPTEVQASVLSELSCSSAA